MKMHQLLDSVLAFSYCFLPGSLIFFQNFFVSSWLIVWADGVNEYGWCLEGGRDADATAHTRFTV